MPASLATVLDKWQEMHPEWTLKLWTPDNIPTLRHQELYDYPETYSPKSNPWQWRSDLVRYEILHDQGGVYVDCDLEPLKPIDPLLTGATDVIAREDRKYLNNAFMAHAPGSRFLADVLAGLEERVLARPKDRVNKQIGAWYLTDLVRHHRQVKVLPTKYIYPFHWSQLDRRNHDYPEAYTRHHWHNKTTQLAAEGGK